MFNLTVVSLISRGSWVYWSSQWFSIEPSHGQKLWYFGPVHPVWRFHPFLKLRGWRSWTTGSIWSTRMCGEDRAKKRKDWEENCSMDRRQPPICWRLMLSSSQHSESQALIKCPESPPSNLWTVLNTKSIYLLSRTWTSFLRTIRVSSQGQDLPSPSFIYPWTECEVSDVSIPPPSFDLTDIQSELVINDESFQDILVVTTDTNNSR